MEGDLDDAFRLLRETFFCFLWHTLYFAHLCWAIGRTVGFSFSLPSVVPPSTTPDASGPSTQPWRAIMPTPYIHQPLAMARLRCQRRCTDLTFHRSHSLAFTCVGATEEMYHCSGASASFGIVSRLPDKRCVNYACALTTRHPRCQHVAFLLALASIVHDRFVKAPLHARRILPAGRTRTRPGAQQHQHVPLPRRIKHPQAIYHLRASHISGARRRVTASQLSFVPLTTTHVHSYAIQFAGAFYGPLSTSSHRSGGESRHASHRP